MEYHLRNEQMIAYHRNKEDYEEQPEDCLQFAYGDRRYVKMTNEIYSGSEVLQLKNLEELNTDYHRADFVTLGLLSSEILSVLIGHLTNTDNRIRELSSSAIVLISAVKLGKEKIIEHSYVKDIMKLLDDSQVKIRENGYNTLLNIAEFQEGIDHVFQMELLVPLVNKLVEEPVQSLLALALTLLEKVLNCIEAQHAVLKTPAIYRLTALLNRPTQIKALACKNLAAISYDAGGKLDIILQGGVLQLCQKLSDTSDLVITNASMALASLAQHNECKFQMMDNNQLDHVIHLLNHPDEQIKLNSIQLLTSLAEHPRGRKDTKRCLSTLHLYATDSKYEYIAPYAQQAIEVINWEP